MRDRMEDLFERLARAVIAQSLPCDRSLFGDRCQLRIATAQRSKSRPRSSRFFRSTAPARIAFLEFREQFGREDLIILAIRPPEVFELGFLERLRDMHEAVEARVPYIDDIQSLIIARSTYGDADRADRRGPLRRLSNDASTGRGDSSSGDGEPVVREYAHLARRWPHDDGGHVGGLRRIRDGRRRPGRVRRRKRFRHSGRRTTPARRRRASPRQSMKSGRSSANSRATISKSSSRAPR